MPREGRAYQLGVGDGSTRGTQQGQQHLQQQVRGHRVCVTTQRRKACSKHQQTQHRKSARPEAIYQPADHRVGYGQADGHQQNAQPELCPGQSELLGEPGNKQAVGIKQDGRDARRAADHSTG